MSREQDLKVAERVLGWHMFRVGYVSTDDETPEQRQYEKEFDRAGFNSVGWYAWTGTEVVLWEDEFETQHCFTEDVSADYQVLRHVRETWDRERRLAFRLALLETLGKRRPNLSVWLNYEPGDYARAALKVVGE